MSTGSQYKHKVTGQSYRNWAKYALCEGQGLIATQKNFQFDLDHLGEDHVTAFYQGFMIPLAFIAGQIPGDYLTQVNPMIDAIQENTSTYDVPCGDDDDWKLLYDRLLCDANINNVMNLFNSFNVGFSWMYVINDFVCYYQFEEDKGLEKSIRDAWSLFMEKHELRIGWTGPGATNTYVICKKGSNKTTGVLTNMQYVYPRDTTAHVGGNEIASVLGLGFYEQDSNRIVLAKDLVQQRPIYRKKLPYETVSCIENGNVVKQRVSIVDTGENGVPPIEVLKLIHSLPQSLVDSVDNEILALNEYLATGASVSQEVSNFMRTTEVLNILNNNSGLQIHNVNPEPLDGLRQWSDAIEKLYVDKPQAKQMPVNDSELEELKRQITELKTELVSATENVDNLNVANKELRAELNDTKAQLDEAKKAVSASAQPAKHVTVVSVTDDFKELAENDKYYYPMLRFCSEIRKAGYEHPGLDDRIALLKLHPLLARLTAASSKESVSSVMGTVELYKAGCTNEVTTNIVEDLEQVLKESL